MHESSTQHQSSPHAHRERGSSMVEYVGLGAVATMLLSGIAAAMDSAAGDRVATALVRRLVAVLASVE